jgi:hypothetical protein
VSHAEHVARLLDHLAVALGEARPVWENNACCLRVEDREFFFFYGEEESALFLQADLGELAALPDQEKAMTTLLRANHFWAGTAGGAFGLSQGRLLYVFRLNFPLPAGWEKYDKDLLPELLPYILSALEAAQDRLDRDKPDRDKPGRPAPEPAREANMLRI